MSRVAPSMIRPIALALMGPIHRIAPDGAKTLCGLPRAMFGRELLPSEIRNLPTCKTCARIERQIAQWSQAVAS
jgi:hypothetical protein